MLIVLKAEATRQSKSLSSKTLTPLLLSFWQIQRTIQGGHTALHLAAREGKVWNSERCVCFALNRIESNVPLLCFVDPLLRLTALCRLPVHVSGRMRLFWR